MYVIESANDKPLVYRVTLLFLRHQITSAALFQFLATLDQEIGTSGNSSVGWSICERKKNSVLG